MTFRTRFAPSPTGYLHVGGARTALYCWLQARKEGGTYVLRIEDTDRERSSEAHVQVILESLGWLGLTADEGPVYQTDRFDRYAEVTEQLLKSGHAYPCYCSREELDEMRTAQKAAGQKPKYDGRCRHIKEVPEGITPVIRFKTPLEGAVVFNDIIRGALSFDNSELDDLVIQRSDGTPTYNLTVVVDDLDMNISHVIRGDDHINNTPKQINIMRAMGASLPQFAHVPMILGEDGARLSKRHGAVSVLDYRDRGILPEALLNYLVRLGWSHGDEEIFTLEDLQAKFDITDVNKAASTFNDEKLLWVNQQHMMKADAPRLAALLAARYGALDIDTHGAASLEDAVALYVERAHTVNELADLCIYLYQDFDDYDESAAKKHLRPVVLEPLLALKEKFSAVSTWDAGVVTESIEAVLQQFELKLPKVAQPLRVALTGKAMSPSIDQTLALAGQALTLRRLDRALGFIEARKAA